MRFKIENTGVALFSGFYAVVGCLLLVYLILTRFAAPPHIGVLGLLSLTAAYGLIRMSRWSVILVIALFFIGITFGATSLYPSVVKETFNPSFELLLFHLALVAYLVMTTLATIYVVSRRRRFGET